MFVQNLLSCLRLDDHGFLKLGVPFGIHANRHYPLLPRAGPSGKKRVPVHRFPRLLRLGRAGLYRAHGRIHLRELALWRSYRTSDPPPQRFAQAVPRRRSRSKLRASLLL